MSDPQNPVSRRPLLYGLAAVLGVAVVGGVGIEMLHPFARKVGGKYGALVSRLPDSESAAKVGHVILTDAPGTALPDVGKLQALLDSKSLAAVLAGDLAANRLVEIRGWLLPATLADLCVLAARNG